jgi:hypothetical protein
MALLDALLAASRPQAYFLLQVGVLCSVAIPWLRAWIGPPWKWNAVDEALNSLHRELFHDVEGGTLEHRHRVTLFKYSRLGWRWPDRPWAGWLRPVARSGTSTRDTSAMFKVPAEPTKAEGVAGFAFRCGGQFAVPSSEEPVLPRVFPGCKKKDLASYANRTMTNVAWIERRLAVRSEELPRSYCGIPIDVGGRRWGVIVIDSARERLNLDEVRRWLRLVAGMLSRLLQESRR